MPALFSETADALLADKSSVDTMSDAKDGWKRTKGDGKDGKRRASSKELTWGAFRGRLVDDFDELTPNDAAAPVGQIAAPGGTSTAPESERLPGSLLS
ncbi:hypothetical protein E4U53_003925 [Claviceps sorghi]|nr:hypothetical protein E4U53_003925 [Claviceps sorghi]